MPTRLPSARGGLAVTNWVRVRENVLLTPKERSRLRVLDSLAAVHMTLDQAAGLMGVTSRHTRRILAAYRERGAAALAHGHGGRRPVNATPEALTAEVVQVARSRGVRPIHPSPYLSLIQLPPFPQPSLLPPTQQQPPLPSRDPFRLS